MCTKQLCTAPKNINIWRQINIMFAPYKMCAPNKYIVLHI